MGLTRVFAISLVAAYPHCKRFSQLAFNGHDKRNATDMGL